MDAESLLEALRPGRFVHVVPDAPGVRLHSPRRENSQPLIDLRMTPRAARDLASELTRFVYGNGRRAAVAARLARELERKAWEWENPPETRTINIPGRDDLVGRRQRADDEVKDDWL